MYTFWTYILLPFAIIKLACRGRKDPEYLKNIPERLGYYRAFKKKFSTFVWIHAVSVGEVFTCQSLVKIIQSITLSEVIKRLASLYFLFQIKACM